MRPNELKDKQIFDILNSLKPTDIFTDSDKKTQTNLAFWPARRLFASGWAPFNKGRLEAVRPPASGGPASGGPSCIFDTFVTLA